MSAATCCLRSRNLCIVDRIYDQILLPPLVTHVLDTPEVQRLRSLHQLGSSSFVFPSATHTRFEHSIGVAFLAGKMLKRLSAQQPELHFTEEDTLLCMLAGLLHDVGHGPFSHLFEDVIAKRCSIPGGFSHEEMSNRLAARALNGVVNEEQLQRILGLMHGTAPPSLPYRDIIASTRGGVDMDRMDYLTRDCVMCFGRPALDTRVNRLLFTSKLFYMESDEDAGEVFPSNTEKNTSPTTKTGEWHLGFERKMALSLQELFALRAKLHKSVYQHPVTKSIGHMIGDIMELAEPFFKVDGTHRLTECVKDEDLFLSLGDWILPAIESQCADPRIIPAQKILARLRRRDIYHKVFSRTLNIFEENRWRAFNWVEAILDALPKGCGIQRKDFIVDIVHVHYGKGKRNPVEDIVFFNPKKPHEPPMRLKKRRNTPPFIPSAAVDNFCSNQEGRIGGSQGTSSENASEDSQGAVEERGASARLSSSPLRYPQISSQLFEEHTLFVFERMNTKGVLEAACEKMISNPSVASLFLDHELPFQN